MKELSNKITETRKGVSSVKSEIDGMRTKRDTFMNDMAMLKAQLKDQNNRMLHAAQEKVRLEKLASESDVKHINLNQLREKQQNVKEEVRLESFLKFEILYFTQYYYCFSLRKSKLTTTRLNQNYQNCGVHCRHL